MSRGKNTGLDELAIDWTLTETPFLGQNGRMAMLSNSRALIWYTNPLRRMVLSMNGL